MAWFRLSILLAGGLFAVALVCPAAPPDANRLENLLAIQTALQQAHDHLQRGHYLPAVQALEAKVAIIDGHREYLRTLRDAYLGLIRELRQSNKADEAETYIRRLKQVDPGAILELGGTPAGSTASTTPAPVQKAAVPNPFTKQRSEPAPTLAALAASTPAPGQTNAVRGVAGNSDPFAEDNSTQMQEARGFLVRAEREFADRNYSQALKFYELANSLAPQLLKDARDRWAYCKLHGVVAALNQADNKTSPQELEQAVRQAMSMAPDKLDRFGQELLRKIADRQGLAARSDTPPAADAQVEVRHLARQGNWAVTETANFRIFHQVSQDTAEKAARQAEATRLTMTRKWFNENPTPWQPKCDVYFHPTGQDYAHATQQPPSVPGHSTIQNEGERIITRRIDLHVDDPNALIGVLPHETTHIVLAGRFGPKPLPRWADEGIAVLSEPADRIQRHLNNLPQHYQDGLLFKLSHLLSMDNYPDARSVGAFYAQGVSLCDYLSKRKGPLVFTQFLRDGMRGGWDAAAQQHYGLRGIAELEQQWLVATVKSGGQVARSDRPRQ